MWWKTTPEMSVHAQTFSTKINLNYYKKSVKNNSTLLESYGRNLLQSNLHLTLTFDISNWIHISIPMTKTNSNLHGYVYSNLAWLGTRTEDGNFNPLFKQLCGNRYSQHSGEIYFHQRFPITGNLPSNDCISYWRFVLPKGPFTRHGSD